MKISIKLTINGEMCETEVAPNTTLADMLRDNFKLFGTRKGCEMGDCGTCTVIMDGNPVNS